MRTSQVGNERSCVKCSSQRTRIAGQSVSPPALYVTCDDCGYSSVVPSASPLPAPPPRTVEAVRVERLVRSIIADFNLPVELVAIADESEGWRLTLRTRLRRPFRIHIDSTEPSAIRMAITRALANA